MAPGTYPFEAGDPVWYTPRRGTPIPAVILSIGGEGKGVCRQMVGGVTIRVGQRYGTRVVHYTRLKVRQE